MTVKPCPFCGQKPDIWRTYPQAKLEHLCSDESHHYKDSAWNVRDLEETWNRYVARMKQKGVGVTKGQMDKQRFVMEYLQPMLADIDPRISSVTYSVANGSETVTIAWETKDGRLHDAVNVNVSCDSKAALVLDVIKRIT